MARPTPVNITEQQLHELERRYRTEPRGRVRVRMGIVLARARGLPVGQVAAAFSVRRKAVTEIVKRFNAEGIAGLYDKKRSGRPRKVPYEKIKALLESTPQQEGIADAQGWNGPLLRKAILVTLGIDYDLSSVYYIAKKLGYTFIKPRPRSYRADVAAQEEWRKKR